MTKTLLAEQVKATRGFWTHEAPRVRALAGQALAPLFRRAPDKALRGGLRALVAGVHRLDPCPISSADEAHEALMCCMADGAGSEAVRVLTSRQARLACAPASPELKGTGLGLLSAEVQELRMTPRAQRLRLHGHCLQTAALYALGGPDRSK